MNIFKFLLALVLVLSVLAHDHHDHDHDRDDDHVRVEVNGRRVGHGQRELFHKVKKACYRDYKRFCDGIEEPESQEASQCMFDHFDELSSRCADVISQHPMVACIADSKVLCTEEEHHKHHHRHHHFHDFLEQPREDIAQCLLNNFDDLTDACSAFLSTTTAFKCQDIAKDSCDGVPPRHMYFCVLGAVNNIEEDSECKDAMLGSPSSDDEEVDDEGSDDVDNQVDISDSDDNDEESEADEKLHTDTQSLNKDSTLSIKEDEEEDHERHDRDHKPKHGRRRRHRRRRRHHDDDDDEDDNDEDNDNNDDVDTHDGDDEAEPEEEEDCDDEESGVAAPGDYYGFDDEDDYDDYHHHHHHFLGFVFLVLCAVGIVKGIKHYKRRQRQGEEEASQREFGYEPLLDEKDLETDAPASTMPNVKTAPYVYGN